MTFRERKPLRNEPDLRRLAEDQFGVFDHAQASRAGPSPAAMTRRFKVDEWERMLPKVYRLVGAPASAISVQWPPSSGRAMVP